jgi:hypothetical protein
MEWDFETWKYRIRHEGYLWVADLQTIIANLVVDTLPQKKLSPLKKRFSKNALRKLTKV